MTTTITTHVQNQARAVHQKSLIIDAACPGDYWHKNFERWQSGGATCCFVTMSTVEDCRTTLANIAELYKLVRDNEHRLVVATTTNEIRKAKQDGKLAIVLHFQGTSPIEYDANLVELFWRLGVRVVQLAYNQRNPICDGCIEPANAGLSSLGHSVVAELNRLGIAIDLSHTGIQASFDAIAASSSPCVVSHANARAVHNSRRNLPDDLIRAVANSGGVIGLNGFPGFVSSKDAPTLDDFIDHLVHFDSIAGSGHVGLGIDYYQGSTALYKKNVAIGKWDPNTYPKPPYHFPAGVEDPSTLNRLTDRLVERGYTDDEVRGVLGENWMHVLDRIWNN